MDRLEINLKKFFGRRSVYNEFRGTIMYEDKYKKYRLPFVKQQKKPINIKFGNSPLKKWIDINSFEKDGKIVFWDKKERVLVVEYKKLPIFIDSQSLILKIDAEIKNK